VPAIEGLPNITVEQALMVLLQKERLLPSPVSRTPCLEAVVGIGKGHHAHVGLQREDIDALVDIVKKQLLQQSSSSAQQTEARTVRTELKDGSLVVLENYRPKPNVGGSTQKELREYALGEFAPFLELAEQGKIRALVVAVETDDDRLSITYPVGQWEPGLIAGALLLQRRLLDQG
jgi:hypothetical protein